MDIVEDIKGGWWLVVFVSSVLGLRLGIHLDAYFTISHHYPYPNQSLGPSATISTTTTKCVNVAGLASKTLLLFHPPSPFRGVFFDFGDEETTSFTYSLG